jgi:hypothetical protein
MGSSNTSSLVAELSPEVLALLAASYGKPAAEVVEQATKLRKASKPSRLAAVKAAAIQAEETHPVTPQAQPAMTVIALPQPGTLDARGFLLALRRASTRDQQIQAIAGYCGFDRHGDFGSQELAARMQAQRALKGGVSPLTRPVNTAVPTVAGFVAGVPDGMARKVADLLARERMAAEAIGEHEQIAANAEVDAATRSYHAQLALVEQGRISQIRADLATLGVRVSQ